MRREFKVFAIVISAVSALFAVLLFIAIHDECGVAKSLLFCLLGIAAIWILGYLKARLIGWIRPRPPKNGGTKDT